MRVEKSVRTVFTPLEDGTGVLLNVDTLYYYSINKTGVVLWKEIEANPLSSLDGLAKALCDRFEIDRDLAQREATAFAEKLSELRLLRLVR